MIVPIHNAVQFLERTLASLSAAVDHHPDAELVLVDHESDDGSWEYINDRYAARALIRRVSGGTISRVRNVGAAAASGEYLSFIDSDCMVEPDYLTRAVRILERTGAAATGSRVDLPESPHWIEATWISSNATRSDGFTHFMNSGNFFVRAEAFHEVGGFDESILTGEDAEICRRLTSSGNRIFEARTVRAVHLGNARTIPAFFRKEVWRGLGQFATMSRHHLDKPVIITLLHLGLTCGALLISILRQHSILGAAAFILAAQWIAPGLTVLYRGISNRAMPRPLAALFLYWLYYWARVVAMIRTAGEAVSGRARRRAG